MDRTERQKLCLKKWIKSGGAATCVLPTGFGKTRIALMLAEAFVKRNSDCSILVVVPTQILKDQWIDQLNDWNLLDNVRVEIINTVVKSDWTCDLLIEDEAHLYASDLFSKVFQQVNYKNILCLTGTLERLDGREQLIKKYAPVCDTMSIEEAEKNGWVSPKREYLVLIDVDLTEYKAHTKIFNQCFSQFDYDFNLAMQCATNIVTCRKYAKEIGMPANTIMGIAQKWNRAMRARKQFIQNHQKKFDIAKKIIKAREDKKIITFSATIKQAESFGFGYVVHSDKKKKENQKVIDDFNNCTCCVLHSAKCVDTGIDIKGVNCEIILNVDSSKIRKTQRIGRAIRFEKDKTTEIFTIVLKGTQEEKWFANSNTSKVIIIDENQLDDVLNGKEIETRNRELIVDTKYRY